MSNPLAPPALNGNGLVRSPGDAVAVFLWTAGLFVPLGAVCGWAAGKIGVTKPAAIGATAAALAALLLVVDEISIKESSKP